MRQLNERGAIMLIAVFFAIFGVAILYYMIGMSQAVLFRERMQDAADATALSDAITNARGMNFIVLLNIVMAALMAILVTIKLVEGLAILGMFIAAALAWPTFGASLAAIPPLRSIQQGMSDLYEVTKTPVYTALEILHQTATTVKQITPGAADEVASSDGTEHWGNSSIRSFALGSRVSIGLPVEDDSFDNLCGRAGTYPAKLAANMLSGSALQPIANELSSAMGEITQSLSSWFCGDSSGTAPKYETRKNAGYPKLQSDGRCTDDSAAANDRRSMQASDATNPECERLRREEQDAQPDPRTGSCQAGHDCRLGGPYDSRVTAAREQCDPTQSPAPNSYDFQYRTGQVYYQWVKGSWQRLEPQFGSYEYAHSDLPPCGPLGVNPSIAVGYNKVVRTSQDVDDVTPVCSSEQVPETLQLPRENELSRRIDFVEVTQILGCTKQETKHVDFNLNSNGHVDTPVGPDESEDKSPKRLESNAALGDESFQVRSLTVGQLPTGLADHIVNLPLSNRGQTANPLTTLEPAGKIAFAQAEYYYGGSECRDEWMWNMKWRARLRRFRLPDNDQLLQFKALTISIMPDAAERLADAGKLSVH
jgi:hypothetical protein